MPFDDSTRSYFVAESFIQELARTARPRARAPPHRGAAHVARSTTAPRVAPLRFRSKRASWLCWKRPPAGFL
jgi:hypothetical protein